MLTPKQQRFVAEYLKDLCATAAYRRAGYRAAGHAAEVNAAKLLRNTEVQNAIALAEKERAARVKIEADNVLRELARIAFSDMRDFVDWGPEGVRLKPSAELGDDDAPCVAEVTQTSTEHGGSIRFKLHSKTEALRDLCRHLGLLKDKLEVSGPDGGPFKVYLDVDPEKV